MKQRGLDLTASSRVLDTHARRFYDKELPPPLQSQAFARFDRRRFSTAELAWGRSAWQQRTLDEYRSLVGLSQYLDELGVLGLAFDAVSTAVRVVRDEARHVELCRRMVHALGGDDAIPGTPAWVRSNPRRPLFERVLETTLGSLCIGETFSVALLVKSRDVAKEPLSKSVLTLLAADESVHSQLGWTLLPLLWREAKKPVRARLLRGVRSSLDYAAKVSLEEGDDARARNPFGDLKPKERRAVFHQSVERDVLGRFAALGIRLPTSESRPSTPGRSTWARRTTAAAGS